MKLIVTHMHSIKQLLKYLWTVATDFKVKLQKWLFCMQKYYMADVVGYMSLYSLLFE